MSELQFQAYIKKMLTTAIIKLVSIVTAIIFIPLSAVFIVMKTWFSIIPILVSIAAVAFSVINGRCKKFNMTEPYTIEIKHYESFSEMTRYVLSKQGAENILTYDDKTTVFSINQKLKARILFVNIDKFNKNEYDAVKSKVNRLYNKKYHISQWVSRDTAQKMMRFNVICAEAMNDELECYISENALHNLTRVEGVINFAVYNNRLIIPPLNGNADISEIARYRNAISDLSAVLS